MNGLLRKWFRLDKPEAHLNRGQFAFALAVGLASACLWGWITRVWFVFFMISLMTPLAAWLTPTAEEKPLARILTVFMQGGIFALFGSLAVGRIQFH